MRYIHRIPCSGEGCWGTGDALVGSFPREDYPRVSVTRAFTCPVCGHLNKRLYIGPAYEEKIIEDKWSCR